MSSSVEKPRTSTCRIERGLYVLRYVEGPDESPPVASVRIVDGAVELIGSPGRDSGTLEAPGAVLVVLARTRGVFDIEVAQLRRGFGTEARFSLDLLDEGAGDRPGVGRKVSSGVAEASPAPPAPVPLAIVAHVSRRGDVRAGAGDWVAGPSEILPIEGLSISTGRRDVTVALRVQTVETQGRWSRWHGDGEFAGSRQRADALTAIELALEGEACGAFVLACEVMSLGTSSRRIEGREVEIFGYEPIVGFRLELKNATDSSAAGRFDARSPPASRLKVFRARK